MDGGKCLSEPFTELFKLIYQEKRVPGQWLIAKTMPIYKNKGQTKDKENYGPIANLFAASKILEKIIMKRIIEIQKEERKT
jgi:hypothetical protein